MIEYTFIGLVSFAIILLLISFFQRDRMKEVEEQVEQLTLSTMQQLYEVKKRVKALEEELLIGIESFSNEEQIAHLYKQGWTKEQIARKLNMPIDEVNIMIARNER
ncbi:hypothetical protein NP92_09915 [Anoxybacillus gonensis]|uniref:Uncharacterized protein n=1 Tax=Anoxybacillus gonensis TaxID=198467 RepID=A0AAW7TBI6_9BACL|nr:MULTISPECIES: competence protein CoiA family protein [Anoxybacillus]AKS38919.1 hypothetical protein AFK25_10130 [Anoxybacillus gonensis]KGP59976.1 hypothetical protein NP92_09915 [Anoxybacillus gonensis]MDO0876143.1 hypothetical protein [Anoxybacillus gonensis]